MKIIVKEKEKSFEGKIIEGKASPFGNSAHIPISKEHVGKILNVIIPENTKYCWLLSTKEINEFLQYAKKHVMQSEGRLAHHKKALLTELAEDTFSIETLEKVLSYLPSNDLTRKIKSKYNL